MPSGKNISPGYPNGLRRVTAEGKLAPKSLRKKHRLEKDCTDAELAKIKIKREDT
jgi:hypothetical protein